MPVNADPPAGPEAPLPTTPPALSPLPVAPPRPITPPSPALLGIAIALLAGTVLYVGGRAVAKSYSEAFFSIPFFVGVVSGLWSARHPVRNGAVAFAAALVLAIATLREGVVCVLFALPILIPLMGLGVLAGNVLRRYIDTRRGRSGATVLLVLASLGWQALDGHLDDPSRHPWHRIDSAIDIAAPPALVFASLAEGSRVAGPWPWFIRIGLPVPRSMDVVNPGPQGRIVLTFNHGRALARITDWQPGRALAFQVERYEIDDPPFFITRLGRSTPHYGLKTERVDDWLTFGDIRYTLTPVAGGTRLRRETTFQRHLSPALYFGWLQERVIGRGQQRLLQQLRGRAEDRARLGDTGVAAIR